MSFLQQIPKYKVNQKKFKHNDDNLSNVNGMDTTDNTSVSGTSNGQNVFSIDEVFQGMVVDKFLRLTDRKKICSDDNKLKPDQFHNWGKLRNISNKSPTLHQIISRGGINQVRDFKRSFEEVLNELDIEFRVITDVKPNKSSDNVVFYDIRKVPAWSFHGVGSSQLSAEIVAARRGLEFLIAMH